MRSYLCSMVLQTPENMFKHGLVGRFERRPICNPKMESE